MDLQTLVTTLQEGGPWALMAISFIGTGFVARSYVKVRDRHEEFQKGLLEQMSNILVESTEASVRQGESNEQVRQALERVERRVEQWAK